MKRVMFVCQGNICRSPMAEYVMRDYVNKLGEGDNFIIASAAISDEEIGNPVHPGTKKILDGLGLDCSEKRAVRLLPSDYKKYDYFVGMDETHRKYMLRLFGGDIDNKVSLLLDYIERPRDVLDPWYTGEFDKAYKDIIIGIKSFYHFIMK